jgi:signal transduction histidine kinase/CheY-like chemotaxis protein
VVLNSSHQKRGDAPLPGAESRNHLKRSPATRVLVQYGISIASIGVSIAVTLVFWEAVFSRNPFALFYAAVMLSAWCGGIGPGLLASALALLAIDYLLMPSFFSVLTSFRGAVQASTFVGIAVLLSWLNASRDRAMDDLRRAKEEADSANEAKDQFLAVLSHELRTPLTPALGLASILEKDPTLSDETRADATLIRRNIELEARLIDDLLDITRIRRGKLALTRQELDPLVLIEHVIGICKADLDAKSIEIRAVLPAATHRVNGDPARLQQILWNLLKNAIKFTPMRGQITVNCCDEDGRLKIDVIDSGIGIEPEVLPRIFNAFEQGGSKITRRFGGMGLGLAISKALAEAHGGTLSAASEGTGRGACFTLTLATLPVAAPEAADEPSTLIDVEPLKVLLVEDHPDTSQVMTRLLRNLHHDVQTASSVTAARQLAKTQKFDVLISDIGLPDGTGLELMQSLQAGRPMRGIAMSGFGMEEDVRRSLHAGFHTHLTKPVNLNLLEAAISELATCARTA